MEERPEPACASLVPPKLKTIPPTPLTHHTRGPQLDGMCWRLALCGFIPPSTQAASKEREWEGMSECVTERRNERMREKECKNERKGREWMGVRNAVPPHFNNRGSTIHPCGWLVLDGHLYRRSAGLQHPEVTHLQYITCFRNRSTIQLVFQHCLIAIIFEYCISKRLSNNSTHVHFIQFVAYFGLISCNTCDLISFMCDIKLTWRFRTELMSNNTHELTKIDFNKTTAP